jgi:hypothetical protein
MVKIMKIKSIQLLFALSLIFTFGVYAQDQNSNISEISIIQIQDRVDSMTPYQLGERKTQLLAEANQLENEKNTSQSPARQKNITSRLKEIFTELDMIEKAFVLVGGIAIADNLLDDDDKDTVAPIITLAGDNPATVELGSTYTDAGATADTGETVTSSGTVDTNTVGTYTINYSATDASGNVGTASRSVNVVDTQAPVISSSATFTAAEDQTSIGTVVATDPSGTVTYSVSGSEIQIGASSGVLSFVGDAASIDFETKSTYTATVTVSDGTNSGTQNITVNLTDVNESPYIVTTSFTVEEDQTFAGNVNATDPEGEALTYTVAGSEFVIVDSNLSFAGDASSVDYETKSTYTATVTVSDGTNSSTQNITVNLTDVNESPYIVTTSFTVEEDQTFAGNVNATDPEGEALTYTVAGSEFVIVDSNLSFAGDASSVDYETKSTYTATVTVSDGVNSRTQNITVNLTDVNESPYIVTTSFTVPEGQTFVGNVNATDPEGEALTYTVAGSEFVIEDSNLSFVTAADYETKSTYTATVTVSDGVNSKTQDITVTVTDVTDEDGTGTGTGTSTSTGTGTGTGTSTSTGTGTGTSTSTSTGTGTSTST